MAGDIMGAFRAEAPFLKARLREELNASGAWKSVSDAEWNRIFQEGVSPADRKRHEHPPGEPLGPIYMGEKR